MIKHIERESFSRTTFRYASQEEDRNILQEMGMDPENVEEILFFLDARDKTSSLKSLLDKPFELKSQLAPKPLRFSDDTIRPAIVLTVPGLPRPTRFSDGTIPVFYSALEPETAEVETFAWYAKYALRNASQERTAYYQRIACDFQGDVKDLRPHLQTLPCLIQDEAEGYPDCNRIGIEAFGEGIYGLLTPSARKLEGTCLPVFRREALSNPQSQALVAFKFDPSSGKTSILAG
ncbi:MAG TPA: RES family NAD+ phosphorylase [Nitrosospira sp.]|nr:RES family NAD+ phosphorylase [Nitrosospira sp.]